MSIDGAHIQRARTAEEIYQLWGSCNEATTEDTLSLLATQTISILTKELNQDPDYLSPQTNQLINQIKVRIGDLHQSRISGIFATVHSQKTLTKIQNSLYSLEILNQRNQEIYSFLKLDSPTEIELQKIESLADYLIKEFKNNIIEIGYLVSYAFQLYEKAADGYRVKGQFDRVADICRKTANPDLILAQFPLRKIKDLAAHSVQMDHPLLGQLNFGLGISMVGGGLVKGGNLRAKAFILDGKAQKELSFKLNYWAADRFRGIVKSLPEAKKAIEQSGLCSNVTINTDDKYYYYPKVGNEFTSKGKLEMGSAICVQLEGLATIKIGSDPTMGSMYNLVKVEMNPHASIEQLQKAFAILGLSPLMTRSKPEDIERLKINTLFHTYYPREAFDLERKASFYLLALDELKGTIIKAAPGMKRILNEKLPLVKTFENMPGEVRCMIPNAAEEVKALGGRGLISGVTGNLSEAAKNIASICRSGFLSSQTRFENGLLLAGASSIEDHKNNSADSIFMRAVTQNALDFRTNVSVLTLRGSYQILCKLDAYNLGPYVHDQDFYGCRNPLNVDFGDKYQFRFSFLEHTLKNEQIFESDNEVCNKGKLDPAYIAGIIYQDPRRILLQDLLAVNASYFPTHLIDDKQKMEYIEKHPHLILNELKKHPDQFKLEKSIVDPQDMIYRGGYSILKHWTQDPKKVLIEELRKVGFKSEFNMVNFEELIQEKEKLDDDSFRRCHEHITPSDL